MSTKSLFCSGIGLFILLGTGLSEGLPADFDAAKKEGTIVAYGTLNFTDIAQVKKIFKQKFPNIEHRYLRSGGRALYERILAETKAGRNAADVYHISGMQTWLLNKRGLLSSYLSPERAAIRERLKDRDGYWTGLYINTYVLAYNTQFVQPQDVPRSYRDLLLPRWKGKMALDNEAYDWYANLIQIMGREKALNLIRDIARQDLRLQRGSSNNMQLLCAGEFAIDIANRLNIVERYKDLGCPTDWVAVEPVPQRAPVAVAIAKSPPHPSAARLYVDFLLSHELQQFLASALKRESTRSDVDPVTKRIIGLDFWNTDWEDVYENYGEIVKTYMETFGLH